MSWWRKRMLRGCAERRAERRRVRKRWLLIMERQGWL
jgi:hypothetical protein